jgi:hypothetical protein
MSGSEPRLAGEWDDHGLCGHGPESAPVSNTTPAAPSSAGMERRNAESGEAEDALLIAMDAATAQLARKMDAHQAQVGAILKRIYEERHSAA